MNILHHTLISTINNDSSTSNFDSKYQIKFRICEIFWDDGHLKNAAGNGNAYQVISIQDDYQTHIIEIGKENTQYDEDSIIYDNKETSGYVDIILNLNEARIPLISWTGNNLLKKCALNNIRYKNNDYNLLILSYQSNKIEDLDYKESIKKSIINKNMVINKDEMETFLEDENNEEEDFIPSSYVYIKNENDENEEIRTTYLMNYISGEKDGYEKVINYNEYDQDQILIFDAENSGTISNLEIDPTTKFIELIIWFSIFHIDLDLDFSDIFDGLDDYEWNSVFDN